MIYFYQGDYDFAKLYSTDPAEELTPSQLGYFLDSYLAGARNEVLEDMGNGCTVEKHWPVVGKEVFAEEIIIEKRQEKAVLPDVFVSYGIAGVVVSKKAKTVIESIDPNIHQFSKIRVVEKNTEVSEDYNYFAMVVGRIVNIEKPVDHHPLTKTDTSGLPEAIKSIDRTPGFAQRIEDLPLWTFPSRKGTFFFNEEMSTAFKEIGVTGLKEKNLNNPYHDEINTSVAHVWFREMDRV